MSSDIDKISVKANELINSDFPDILHKTEKEDGDYLFYDQKTNEFLVLSSDGYIRTTSSRRRDRLPGKAVIYK